MLENTRVSEEFSWHKSFRCSICQSFLRYEDESTETKEDQRYKLLKTHNLPPHLPPPSPPPSPSPTPPSGKPSYVPECVMM